jgi:hypothetical protein
MSRKAELAHWQTRAKELLSVEQAASHHPSIVRETRATYRVTR